jgi:peroxiredoxin
LSNRSIIILSCILAAISISFHFSIKRQPKGEEIDDILSFFNKPLQWHGRFAPDFEIELLDGEKFKLSDNIGKKVIILNFFATWCGPCKDELPELNKFYETHKDESFILLGINADDEREDTVKDFIKENNIEFPIGIDKDGKIEQMYAVRGLPVTVFIGADGRVSIYEVGPIMNADIAFENLYKINMESIKAGKGITKEAYLKNLEGQKDLPSEKEKDEEEEEKEEDKEEEKLTGRAKDIVIKMDCPCGCSHKVDECGCKTADDIIATLKKQDLSDKSDVDIIKELNKEFCKKDDKS